MVSDLPPAGEILFIAHRIPFPPDRGDKIRSHHVLKALAALAPVHVATFADDAHDGACEPELVDLAASHCLVQRRKPLVMAGVEALARRCPVSLTAFDDPRLRAYVRKVLATRPISGIYVFSGQMGQYVPASFTGRVVMDLVDVDSAKFESYGQEHTGLRAWVDRREARLLRAEETRMVARADVTLLVSQAEAALLGSRQPAGVDVRRIASMGNGLDADVFDPQAVDAEPRICEAGGPRLVFTGQMDYGPNIAAAQRAITRILPRLRKICPDATLHIVGRNPPQSLLAHHGLQGAYVWGRVADIRPWLVGADMALVPLHIARGVQNKVLEAMAMELPVVLTSGAATGIDAQNGEAFCVAIPGDGEDDSIVDLLSQLAEHRSQRVAMGKAARTWIRSHMSWDTALADLPIHMGLSHKAAVHAA